MARSSDTRKNVRAAAQQLIDQGITPSSRKVRELLGGGSLSTITDELRLLESEATISRPLDSSFAEDDGAIEAIADVAARRNTEITPPSTAMEGAVQAMSAELGRLSAEVHRLTDELGAARTSHEKQLAVAYERYDAVQRYSMQQIEDARRTAAELREKLSNFSVDAQIREDAQRGKTQALRDENAMLRAKVEVLERLLPAQMDLERG